MSNPIRPVLTLGELRDRCDELLRSQSPHLFTNVLRVSIHDGRTRTVEAHTTENVVTVVAAHPSQVEVVARQHQ